MTVVEELLAEDPARQLGENRFLRERHQPVGRARKVMPMKSKIRRAPSHASTTGGFFASGGLKAGTPSETASTPVSAAQPDANARRTRKGVRSCAAGMAGPHHLRQRVPAEGPADESVDDQDAEAGDEQVSRQRKELAGLAKAPEVGERDQGDERHADDDAVRVEPGTADVSAATRAATLTATVST